MDRCTVLPTHAVREAWWSEDLVADDAADRSDGLDPLDLVRAIVDPVRLAVLGASVSGPPSVDALASSLGVERKEIAGAIGYLRGVALLDEAGQLDRGKLNAVARALPKTEAEPVETQPGLWTHPELEVLDRFFAGPRLTTIPSAFAKRKLVLEKIVQDFEPGIRYQERDVNFKLQLIHADYAALRRYLVDGGFLGRAEGFYWRTGGRHLPDVGAPADAGTVATGLDGVTLVPFHITMVDDLARVANDESVSRHLTDGFPFPYTADDARTFVVEAAHQDPPLQYAVTVGSEFAGGVGGVAHRHESTGTLEIGWWLGAEFWRRGIASAAVQTYVDLLFTDREAMRVSATVMGDNEPSKRVAEKAGLMLEGISRSAYLKRGVRFDAFIYGLDRSTWLTLGDDR
jgi:RimJ/RimL family protein N-acetyltransferase